MSDKQIAIVELLKALTNGSPRQFDWQLTGNAAAPARQAIMSFVLGRKAKRAESGINALRAALWELFNVSDDCIAGMNNQLFERMGV